MAAWVAAAAGRITLFIRGRPVLAAPFFAHLKTANTLEIVVSSFRLPKRSKRNETPTLCCRVGAGKLVTPVFAGMTIY